jgi:hypothetical protein
MSSYWPIQMDKPIPRVAGGVSPLQTKTKPLLPWTGPAVSPVAQSSDTVRSTKLIDGKNQESSLGSCRETARRDSLGTKSSRPS